MLISKTLRLLAVLVALTLATGAAAALAQDDATPEADSSGATTSGGGDPAAGDEVQYLDEGGDEIAIATVTNVTDNFDEFDEFFTPDEGTRYVAVEIGVRSTGDELDVESFDFSLLTTDGFLYSTSFVSREDDAEPPELEDTEVEEGDAVSGVIFFSVPEDAELDRLMWQPDSGRLLILANLSDAAAA